MQPPVTTTERAEAIERLREWVKPGDIVYTVLRHVSASGMSRDIDLIAIHENEPLWLSYNAAKAMGRPMHKDSIRTNGCGMDTGFELVYDLGRILFDDGYALNQRWL